MAKQIYFIVVVDFIVELGEDVVVGFYVVINVYVYVGDCMKIGLQVVLGVFILIGEDNLIYGQVSFGGDFQDFLYCGEDICLVIGD